MSEGGREGGSEECRREEEKRDGRTDSTDGQGRGREVRNVQENNIEEGRAEGGSKEGEEWEGIKGTVRKGVHD